ncbi:hypothetical protein SRAA_1563 [Serpentinimonas raichei]|uniref:Periplasmic protein TonB, links inner and outer membranes n=1 Tax=Serpentinimonas raichei TaxID=1458425 RepID=A0A060NJ16_9BURK|nr:energy transducer TonB [Serpentinimonas raichei]BAO81417.1 hypothetical protein SRAA_1563 [Serpentinimonas raichei]
MHPTPPDLNPPAPGHWRLPLALALGIHALLVLALSASVNWQREPAMQVVQAELWAQLPQAAQAPPAPTPVPAPVPPAPPAPPPPAPPVVRPPTPAPPAARVQTPTPAPAATIAIEQQRERERIEQRQAQLAERERREQEAQREAEHQRNIERIMGRAAATAAASPVAAAPAASPSPGYASRLAAAIRPNIVFTEVLGANPRAEVELRALPDGTILSTRLLQSSGHAGWDAAVLRAIERTGRLPRDTDGRVPSVLILGFRPQD